MKRKIYDELIKWKNNYNGKTAVLIDGARRVGKSYIVEEFAKNNYKKIKFVWHKFTHKIHPKLLQV